MSTAAQHFLQDVRQIDELERVHAHVIATLRTEIHHAMANHLESVRAQLGLTALNASRITSCESAEEYLELESMSGTASLAELQLAIEALEHHR